MTAMFQQKAPSNWMGLFLMPRLAYHARN